MIKKYKISSAELYTSLTVEIDHELLTVDKLHEVNNFWSSAQDMLNERGGNVLFAVLDRLFTRVMHIQICHGWRVDGLIKCFDYNLRDWDGDTEGLPKMDGSEGIKIIDVENLDFEDFGFDIEEVT